VSLKLEQLSVRYGSRPILHEIQLEVPRGHCCAILGPNGAGKSTLLRTIAGFLKPHQGTIRLCGEDGLKLRPAARARWLAYMAQRLETEWPLKVRDFLALGRWPHQGWTSQWTPADQAILMNVVQVTGLEAFLERRLQELSGGEQQRVRLARALIQSPRVLLLDEPIAFLDGSTQLELLQHIRRMVDSCELTVLMTLHDVNLAARFADQLGFLREGRLIAVGSPAQVLGSSALEATFGLPWQALEAPQDPLPWMIPRASTSPAGLARTPQ